MDSNIYNDPELYGLEHSGDSQDLAFCIRFARTHRPVRILEIGCGDGRLTIPVAEAAAEWGAAVCGLDTSRPMLDRAMSKSGADTVDWIEGDVRTFERPSGFDWIYSGCSTLSHLTTSADLLAAWRTASSNLSAGGRFLVAELMADLPALAESMSSPPRVPVQFDLEAGNGADHLVRYRATLYQAHTQTADVHYLYDHFERGRDDAERRLSQFRAHVFFPHEFQLLFLAAGLELEHLWGDFRGSRLASHSRHLIGCGRKRSVPTEAGS